MKSSRLEQYRSETAASVAPVEPTYQKMKDAVLTGFGVVLDATEDLMTVADDNDFLCESKPILDAIETYARQFYIPMTEGETIEGWFARLLAKHDAMRGPAKSEMYPFLAMMKAIIAAAQGIDPDELVLPPSPDPFANHNLACPGCPACYATPSRPTGAPNAAIPGYPPVVHSTGRPQISDPYGIRCSCGDPNCSASQAISNAAKALSKARAQHIGGSPATRKWLGIDDASSADPQDSIPNPPVKGFVGSKNLPFDSDYD